ncbi:zinc-finger domain-containing protein [Acetobacter sp. DmW_136]|uniref:zinc-finger domain-containing protein n=1 Tax=Acetobacter sp. DmW_136 TaxID=2591091 RepID=UPI0012395303|nr:zinc-finger domain-containing protein [Acetobacter sp. DmW_136]KAA8384509.1 zinc-finger domain-containing protein [Acetobacter sp. DmW_136]
MLIQPANPVPHPKLGHVETIMVDKRKIACDGGLSELGHPRVWLKIGGHQTVCSYCSRLFVLQPDAEGQAEH